jgi:anti-sigma factor (TIGR02949 family)
MPKSRHEKHDKHEKISCEEVIAHLFAFLDDETDSKKRSAIEKHLQECRGCFSRAEFERALRARVRQLGGSETPATLRRRVKTLLDQF